MASHEQASRRCALCNAALCGRRDAQKMLESAEPLRPGLACPDCAPHVVTFRCAAEARWEAELARREREWFPNLTGEMDSSDESDEGDDSDECDEHVR